MATDAVEIAQHLRFDLELLHHRLHHQVDFGSSVRAGRCGDSGHGLVVLALVDLLLRQQSTEALADLLDSGLEGALRHVDHDHIETAEGGHLGNSMTHGACTDHANRVDFLHCISPKI